ncbi:hypothetical protein [Thalassotalea agarivorans]|nr:hypothetical protein [Thalassotalea agarivorans]
MTAFKFSFWPIILTGCRHYRLPVPMHFIIDIYKQRTAGQTELEGDINE